MWGGGVPSYGIGGQESMMSGFPHIAIAFHLVVLERGSFIELGACQLPAQATHL